MNYEMMLMDLTKVAKWHKIAGVYPNPDLIPLQQTMLVSELEEYNEAKRLVDIIDGIGDVYFLHLGMLYLSDNDYSYLPKTVQTIINELDTLLHHSSYDIHDVLDEVYRANLSKFCTSVEKAEQSIDKYLEMGVQVYYSEVTYTDETFYVLRILNDVTTQDGKHFPKGKIMKSVDFLEPDHSFIIEELGGV